LGGGQNRTDINTLYSIYRKLYRKQEDDSKKHTEDINSLKPQVEQHSTLLHEIMNHIETLRKRIKNLEGQK
jgi:archaellum component FlaC